MVHKYYIYSCCCAARVKIHFQNFLISISYSILTQYQLLIPSTISHWWLLLSILALCIWPLQGPQTPVWLLWLLIVPCLIYLRRKPWCVFESPPFKRLNPISLGPKYLPPGPATTLATLARLLHCCLPLPPICLSLTFDYSISPSGRFFTFSSMPYLCVTAQLNPSFLQEVFPLW